MKLSNSISFVLAIVATAPLAQTLTSPAYADTSNPTNRSISDGAADVMFMKMLAAGSVAEIDAAKLAISKASSKEVKEFAERMVTDHSKNGEQLKALAAQRQVTLPNTADSDHVVEKAKLEKQSGAGFDAEYMQSQVNDHQQVARLLQQEIDSGQDSSVQAFAQQTLAAVQHHLEMAKDIQARVIRSSH